MSNAAKWTDAAHLGSATIERTFRVEQPDGVVPGVAWLPRTPPPWGLVLLAHGGSGHKRSDHIVAMGRWFSASAGLAAVAIDGPYHGDRVGSPLSADVYQRRMLDEGLDVVTSRMISDWGAAVDAVDALEGVDRGRIGYFGMSMGTRFGVPFAAWAGAGLRCAVLGKFGLTAAPGYYADTDSASIVQQSAGTVSAATMFHVQLDDELFPREGQVSLFESLGAADKVLVACPGTHAERPPTATELWRHFIVGHLRPEAPRDTSPSPSSSAP